MSTAILPEKLLTTEEAAALLTVAPGSLEVWRSTGRYQIPFLKVGYKVRYRMSDLLAWLETRQASQTGEIPLAGV
jgi:excisionase family DNA binding protein